MQTRFNQTILVGKLQRITMKAGINKNAPTLFKMA